MADSLPKIINITRLHKQQVQDIIATLLPPSEKQAADAQALTVAIDGDVPALGARERILLTAQKLFYRDGIRATGINRVIAESSVSKVTFYRHFSSKNTLILEVLECRHNQWIGWFMDALQRHGGNIDAIVPAMSEWFLNEGFRGCAFINSVVEMADSLPKIISQMERA